MTTDLDIYRAANLLGKQHGADPPPQGAPCLLKATKELSFSRATRL